MVKLNLHYSQLEAFGTKIIKIRDKYSVPTYGALLHRLEILIVIQI